MGLIEVIKQMLKNPIDRASGSIDIFNELLRLYAKAAKSPFKKVPSLPRDLIVKPDQKMPDIGHEPARKFKL